MKCFSNSPTLPIIPMVFLWAVFAVVADAGETVLFVAPEGHDTWSGDRIDRPFATIQKARDSIRAMKKRDGLIHPITVYIRGGLYELDETLVFTPADSGTRACPITYTAYQDEEPIISGGRSINGPWTDYQDEIKVCSLPAVRDGTWQFRQLFLNGKRQQRARFPNKRFYVFDETATFKGHDFNKWKNLNDIEVVIYHSRNDSRLLVSNLDEDERKARFSGPLGIGWGGRNHYYIDNVLEGLDQPGEWYLDRHQGRLYYWPPAGAQLSELRAPVVNELVRFEGDINRNSHIQYIHIRGMTFCDVDYILPKEGIPALRDIGDIWFPSAITLHGISNCVFEGNTVRNVGTYGIDLTGDGNLIRSNTIHDTGGGGIITRSYNEQRNTICYNHIYQCGLVFHSGVGINIDDGGGTIANNLIHHTSHCGIYTRHFATDYRQVPERSNMEQGLIIEYNEIYDVMVGMNHGAGIFVRDDNIMIRNNLIHDVRSAPKDRGSSGWGIYLGCNTRNSLVENNIVYHVQEGIQVWYNNKNNKIFNNIFIDGMHVQIHYANNIDAYHHNVRLLRNIISYSGPDAALYRFRQSSGRSLPTESDYNLIYHTAGKDLSISGLPKAGKNYSINITMAAETFEEWQNLGFDTHSLVADPLFVDRENHDYSLQPESPAFKLGFKPIDTSRVGLRGAPQP